MAQIRPEILCIVDRAGWAHDRKTDALIAALAGSYRVVKRYQADVTTDEIARADLVLLYYWLQLDRLGDRVAALYARPDRFLLGICSEIELGDDYWPRALPALRDLPGHVFANNRTLVERMTPLLGRPIAYTPNGVDTNFFTPPPHPRPSTGLLRVGWAGSLINHGTGHRGVEECIVPAVAAADAEMHLAAREEHWRTADEMRAFYHDIDVYVCASRSEGTPNGCLEAAAAGVPIIGTRVGCLPEFIDHGGNGFFVERDPADIARRLITLRDQPTLRLRLGEAARATAVAWDWQILAQNYARLFAEALHMIPHRA